MKLRTPEPRRLLLRTLDALLAREDSLVLDVGAGDVVAKNRRAGELALAERYATLQARLGYLSLDLAQHGPLRLIGDAHALPVRDGCMDGVLMVSVLEHVEDPRAAVAEALRVLRPGGLFFSYAPFYHPYHPSPHDFFRFTHEGYRHLLRDFSAIELVSGGGYVAVLNDVAANAFGVTRPGRMLASCLVSLPLLPLFALLDAHTGPGMAVGFAALATK